MKPSQTTIASIGIALCIQSTVFGQQFSSGSTGADGPLNVTENTVLDLPPDGILNYTTITISSSKSLMFNRNALNTPVYLLATGDVVIGNGASINVSAGAGTAAGTPPHSLGGPGGFDGGIAAFQGFPPGPGQGPGGGAAGGTSGIVGQNGVFAISDGGNDNVYGNTLLSPLIGGSGGGAGNGGWPGGGGGGAILLASSTKVTLQGGGAGIYANGGYANGSYGSGGAVRVISPIVEGSGQFSSVSGNGVQGGRVRVDSRDRFAHRNIILTGKGTRGSQMFVFPSNIPRLDIINAAGTAIAEGTAAPVTVTLPVGSPTEQTVRIQARWFTGDVPIRVKITPENGTAAVFDAVILAASGNPPFVDVPVTLVIDTVCHVHAWTR